jgi:hypothetical protein
MFHYCVHTLLHIYVFRSSGDDEFESEDGGRSTETKDELQTFVFSATLSKDLQRNLKKRNRPRRADNNAKPASTLGSSVLDCMSLVVLTTVPQTIL